MSTTSRGQRAQREIIAAAADLMLEQGVDGFSLREAARRAGYAPSAIYNHFRDRDALISAVAMTAVGELAAYLSQAKGDTATERLRSLAHEYARFAQERPQGYRLVFDCLSSPPGPWEHYVQVAHPFTMIIAACAEGIAGGELAAPLATQASAPSAAGGTSSAMKPNDEDRSAEASILAYGLWTIVDGHCHLRQKHLAHVTADYDALLDAAVTAYLSGLETNTPTQRSRS